jgi:glucose-1-phosphate cytidylyltransferase
MRVLILAGGLGSRLGSITKLIPKPLVKVAGLPILIHIVKIFIKYNHTNFIIALGYKGSVILEYFIGKKVSRDIKNKLRTGYSINKKLFKKQCKFTFIDTGLKTMTGGRIKRISKVIHDENIFVTYGDGVGNINIDKLKKNHFKKKKLVTVTAVNPPARFGELILKSGKVLNFSEKKPIKNSWINGGFFIMNRKFFKYIKNDKSILERDPLEKITKLGQLNAYKHGDFWQCMDTKRDQDVLNKIIKKKLKN